MRSATRETFFESRSFLGARGPATFALRCGSKKPGPRMQPPETRDNLTGTPGSNRRPSPWQGDVQPSHLERRTGSHASRRTPCDDLEVVNGAQPSQVESVLAKAAIASARPLPVAEVSESMLDVDAGAQLFATGRSHLESSELLLQSFIVAHGHGASAA